MFFQQPCGLSKGKQLTTVSSLSFLRFCLPFGRCDIPFLSAPPLKSSVSFMILNVTKVTTGLLERKRVKQLFPNMVKIPVVSCVQFSLFGAMILWHSQRFSRRGGRVLLDKDRTSRFSFRSYLNTWNVNCSLNQYCCDVFFHLKLKTNIKSLSLFLNYGFVHVESRKRTRIEKGKWNEHKTLQPLLW